MKIKELICKYEALGVQFWLENDKLHYKAHKGVMDKEKLSELKKYKESLIDYIKKSENEVVVHDDLNRYNAFPLTDVQSAYLVGRGESYELGGVGCHAYVELSGPKMDKDRLEKAWHLVIERHDMLRAVINPEGFQEVMPTLNLPPLRHQDLKGLDENKRDLSIEKIRKELSTKVYSPEKWPLYELYLTSTEDKSIIHFSMDMLIADFLSIQKILTELDLLYHEPDRELPELEITFRDVVLFNRSREEVTSMAAKKARHKKYWMDRIETLPGAPDLPLKTKRDFSIEFDRFEFSLDKELWKSFCKNAGNRKITPSSAVLGAYSKVIGRWSSNKNFCLSLTILDRKEIHPKINEIIGDFTTTSILEVKNEPGIGFTSMARTLQDQLWSDMDHNLFTGVEVLREINRKNRSKVLIPVVFTSTIGVEKSSDLPGEFIRDYSVGYGMTQTPQVWIDCQVSERSGELKVNWDIRKGVFPKGLIESLFSTFEEFLKNLSLDEKIWESIEPLNLPQEMEYLRDSFNHKDDIKNNLLHESFLKKVIDTPKKTAIIMDGVEISYNQLGLYSSLIQNFLIKNRCEKGGIVAIKAKSQFLKISSILGTLMSGSAFVLNESFDDAKSLKSLISNFNQCFILGEDLDEYEGLENITTLDLNDLEPKNELLIEEVDIDPLDTAYLTYVKKGEEKGSFIKISHESILNSILGISKKFGINSGDTIPFLSGFESDLYLFDIFAPIFNGASIYLPSKEDIKKPNFLIDLIKENRASILNITPEMVYMILNYFKNYPDFGKVESKLRFILISGSIKDKPIKKLSSLFPKTEIANTLEFKDSEAFSGIRIFDRQKGKIGKGEPLLNQEIYILDDNLENCPDFTIGEIYIGGKGIGFIDESLNEKYFFTYPKTGKRIFKTEKKGRFTQENGFEVLVLEKKIGNKSRVMNFRDMENIIEKHPLLFSSKIINKSKGEPGSKTIAFVEPEKFPLIDNLPKEYKELGDHCTNEGEKAVASIDHDLLSRLMFLIEKTAILDMVKTFLDARAFSDMEKEYSIEDLSELLEVDQGFESLLRRWLNALCDEDFIVKTDSSKFKRIKDFNEEELKDSWDELFKADKKLGYGTEVISFLKDCSDNLSSLFKKEVDILDLFFPQGKSERAFAAYCDNLVNRSLNHVVISGVKKLIEEKKLRKPDEPVRILEIGAGVAGLTTELAPKLDSMNVDYHFTDVSNFFLNEAKSKFSDYPWIHYSLYNINEEYFRQGLKPSTYDIILSSNVMHNSIDGNKVLKKLRELLVPDGAFFIIDATEKHSLLTSFEFEAGLTGFEDVRKEKEQTFFTRNQWEKMIKESGAELVSSFPSFDSSFAAAGQIVFITRFPATSVNISPLEVQSFLKSQANDHMIPDFIEVLPELPFDEKGDLDEELLREMSSFKKKKSINSEKITYNDALEENVAKIWAAVLNIEAISRDDDFFASGGDSLLLAQVISKMRKSIDLAKDWEWEALSREMNKEATIASLCEKLRQKKSINDDPSQNDFQTKKAFMKLADGNKDSLKVIFHTGNGNLTPYRHLLDKIIKNEDRTETIAGFAITDTKEFLSMSPNTLVEKLGQRYAEEILEFGADKVELIGYCSGGLIAVEAARLLNEAGLENLKLSVISTDPSKYLVEDDLLLERAFGKMLGLDLEKLGHVSNEAIILEALKNKLADASNLIPENFLASLDGEYTDISQKYNELGKKDHNERINSFAGELSSKGEKVSPDMLKIFFKMFSHSLKATALYDPLPFAGDISLFRVEDQSSHFLPGVESFSIDFWEDLVLGDLKVIDVKGNHFSCIEPPNVSDLAVLLNNGGF